MNGRVASCFRRTMEDVHTTLHCCSTRTRVEFGGKNLRSQVFSKKMIKNTTNTPPGQGTSPAADHEAPEHGVTQKK